MCWSWICDHVSDMSFRTHAKLISDEQYTCQLVSNMCPTHVPCLGYISSEKVSCWSKRGDTYFLFTNLTQKVGTSKGFGVQLRVLVQHWRESKCWARWFIHQSLSFFSTAVHFLPHITEIMAQLAREAGIGQTKGRNEAFEAVPPLASTSVPSVGGGTANAASNA